MTTALRVAIVDDERLFAELLRVALSNAADVEVVGVLHDVATTVAQVPTLRPAVVLADYHLPDGTGAELARSLRRIAPETSVVVLTGDPSSGTLADVARSGAVGHLTKASGLEEVVRAVRAAAAGEILFA
ncbi:MAG TPA: response regulator transcription factor, partial [Candidatus Limnocylindria bacterium]|nr:response regulator transcription factor [Candidatus Limnocylindria bacterium]